MLSTHIPPSDVLKGHMWSHVVTRGHTWSHVVTRGHSHLVPFRDLSEDTLYSVRVSTQSRCGSETWSKPASIRTKAGK